MRKNRIVPFWKKVKKKQDRRWRKKPQFHHLSIPWVLFSMEAEIQTREDVTFWISMFWVSDTQQACKHLLHTGIHPSDRPLWPNAYCHAPSHHWRRWYLFVWGFLLYCLAFWFFSFTWFWPFFVFWLLVCLFVLKKIKKS